jgi:hypothetical protein
MSDEFVSCLIFGQICLTRQYLSNDFQDLLSDVGIRTRDTWGFEAYYNVAINPWLHLTGDLQVSRNDSNRDDTAIITGVQLVMDSRTGYGKEGNGMMVVVPKNSEGLLIDMSVTFQERTWSSPIWYTPPATRVAAN